MLITQLTARIMLTSLPTNSTLLTLRKMLTRTVIAMLLTTTTLMLLTTTTAMPLTMTTATLTVMLMPTKLTTPTIPIPTLTIWETTPTAKITLILTTIAASLKRSSLSSGLFTSLLLQQLSPQRKLPVNE